MSDVKEVFGNEEEFKKVCEGLFSKFDKHKSGYIGNKELKEGLHSFAHENGISDLPHQEIQDVVASYETKQDSKISLDEFSSAVRKTYAGTDNKTSDQSKKSPEQFLIDEKQFDLQCKRVFEALDAKKVGKISSALLESGAVKLAENLKVGQPSKEAIEKALKTAGQTKEVLIDLKEFKTRMKNLFANFIRRKEAASLRSITEPASEEVETLRKKWGEQYRNYIDDTGLAMAFRIIFAEILSKNIGEEDAYAYTVMRMRQIGSDIAHIQNIKLKKKNYR